MDHRTTIAITTAEGERSVIVRPARQDDPISDITALLHRAYRPLADMGLRFLATYQDDDTTRERLFEGIGFVAILDDVIVGTVSAYSAGKFEECAWYRNAGVWCFGQFAVEPDLQKSGLGSAMLQFVEEVSRREGGLELALDTSEQATHLIDYYTRRGFRFIEYVKWPSTNYRSVVLSKNLGNGDVTISDAGL